MIQVCLWGSLHAKVLRCLWARTTGADIVVAHTAVPDTAAADMVVEQRIPAVEIPNQKNQQWLVRTLLAGHIYIYNICDYICKQIRPKMDRLIVLISLNSHTLTWGLRDWQSWWVPLCRAHELLKWFEWASLPKWCVLFYSFTCFSFCDAHHRVFRNVDYTSKNGAVSNI